MQTKQRKNQGHPNPAIVADIVKRIVRAAHPDKIVMFGSAARGEMGPNSDYDFLVIKWGRTDHGRVLDAISTKLSGKQAPVDVVLVTPEDVERYRDSFCMVICPALEEGCVVYDS